jgi:TetR/AcrR family acrAB operon transcriptional repressor
MARVINKEEKRNSIAISCINLFCQKGIQQTSIEELAKNAGIAKGTIYLYFKNKEEIIFTIWDILTQQHQEAFDKRINSKMSEKEKILEYFNYNDIEENFDKEQILNLYQNFVSSMLIDKTQLYTSYFESFFQKDYDFISTCFYEGIKKGEFFIDNVELLTNTIIMVLKGVLIKAKASNLGFYEAQNILTLHITYLLEQYTNKQKS